MGISTIIYWGGVVLCMYVLWLLAFRTYHTDLYDRPKMDDPVVMPRIAYIMSLAVCFLPIFNIVVALAFFICASIARDDFYVDSWLFDKPKDKKQTEEQP